MPADPPSRARRRRGALLLALLTAPGPACTGEDAAGPRTGVRFVLDAPLCSSVFPVDFYLDGAMLGSDTFRVHLPPDHLESRRFGVSPGTHTIGAQVPGGYVWPDTQVTLPAGTVFEDTLPFYCS